MAQPLRVFLDANILFSACRSAGAIRHLLQMLEAAQHVLVADTYVAEEARRNLVAKGPPDSPAVLEALLLRVSVASMQSGRPVKLDLQWLAEKDRPVLLAAMALECDVLVTGDKAHFGVAYGQVYGGARICSPAQLFEML
jgi:predicted nucleic acid-binding protein